MKSIPKSFPRVDSLRIGVSEATETGEVILNQSQLSTLCGINVAHLTRGLLTGRILADLSDASGKPFFYLRNLETLKGILTSTRDQDE